MRTLYEKFGNLVFILIIFLSACAPAAIQQPVTPAPVEELCDTEVSFFDRPEGVRAPFYRALLVAHLDVGNTCGYWEYKGMLFRNLGHLDSIHPTWDTTILICSIPLGTQSCDQFPLSLNNEAAGSQISMPDMPYIIVGHGYTTDGRPNVEVWGGANATSHISYEEVDWPDFADTATAVAEVESPITDNIQGIAHADLEQGIRYAFCPEGYCKHGRFWPQLGTNGQFELEVERDSAPGTLPAYVDLTSDMLVFPIVKTPVAGQHYSVCALPSGGMYINETFVADGCETAVFDRINTGPSGGYIFFREDGTEIRMPWLDGVFLYWMPIIN